MSAVISAEVAEQRAQEMAALNPADRDVRIVFGILSGVVTDGRSRFAAGRPVSIAARCA